MAPTATSTRLASAFADLALPLAQRVAAPVAHRPRLARLLQTSARVSSPSYSPAHHGGSTRASRALHVCALTVQNEGMSRRAQGYGLTLALQSRSPVRPLADTASGADVERRV